MSLSTSSNTSIAKLKAQSEARQANKDREDTVRKSLLVLILDYLESLGYSQIVQQLESSTHLSLQQIGVADNIDLGTILQEFTSYYQLKYGKAPRLLRRPDSGTDVGGGMKIKKRETVTATEKTPVEPEKPKQVEALSGKKKVAPIVAKAAEPPKDPVAQFVEKTNMKLSGSTNTPEWLAHWQKSQAPEALEKPANLPSGTNEKDKETQAQYKVLKPLPFFGNNEYQELAELIQRDIFLGCPNVKMEDIAGLHDAKRLVREAVVYPVKYPELFAGVGGAWRGILLYGPPGTGKTMLARAIATECQTTLFNVSASTIVSKWRGDSEKLVRVLFEMARHHAPSLIFVDEIESLMGHRGGFDASAGGANSEHEGSLRMKTELLIQLDGLGSTDDHVVLLAASNLPWLLDNALLRRLDKRILVGLPDFEARSMILQDRLSKHASTMRDLDYSELAALTEMYTGSDLQLLCKEALMKPIRRVIDILEGSNDVSGDNVQALIKPVSMDDVRAAIKSTKPTTIADSMCKYEEWTKLFASI